MSLGAKTSQWIGGINMADQKYKESSSGKFRSWIEGLHRRTPRISDGEG